MGSNLNFKNFGNEPPSASNNRPPGNAPLTRQGSIYSLTFDEFQNSIGGMGKDFGSMNMDELLKSIYSAEENNITMVSTNGGGGQDGTAGPGGYLQRQGSLTLPRTLSQKTVDEVWKDVSKELSIGKDSMGATGGSAMPQRQQTLGEITLEEFLVRAGVVREEAQLAAKSNMGASFFGDLARAANNPGLGIGFQQQVRGPTNLMGIRNSENVNPIQIQSSSNLPLNVNGVRSNHHQQQQQQILPKQSAVPFAHQVPPSSGSQLGSPGIRTGLVGLADQVMNNNLVQGAAAFQGGGMGMVGLGAGPGPVGVGGGSPANPVSSDGMGRSNGDTSSVSPVPYMFNGSMRGRKSGGALEKVVERRQRRMIKNRESAARSRARKQAYTMELEAEVAKLKEENEELRKKQAEIMEIQKNQVLEMMNMQGGVKKRCLRRTQTGPW
ncbi:ABSCISIC ACID-INSENSITIVE 5-like protein 5 isoform X2 [Punica granatum]|nr:ABSCISIC ACID-INSENSITIVE 5-like protein 5 isoform X2 [Punica granatum]XP_031391422.1 ABSCISIC ACID-INSENSITIVE 5-like protein 5 isoform X2 [Punica granatum]XP_031391502.1 ABSCISIC ACID-INSENSITIVE 5-like protein 5 isoform X2 [Punica granatum]